MRQKKAMTTTLIYAIIAVLVLVVFAVFAPKAYSALYSGFKNWNSLSEYEQQDIKNDFENFANKIVECKEIKDSFCKCENIFPNFPNSFRDEISLEVLQEKTDVYLTLRYNKNEIEGLKKDIGSGRMWYISSYFPVEEYEDGIREIRDYEYTNLDISFKEEYPVIKGKTENSIASEDIFKGNFAGILYFIIKNEKYIVDDKSFFDEYPKCINMRNDALNMFDSFLNKLKTDEEIEINLPEDYRIFYGERVIQLKHKEEEIERIYDINKNRLEKRTAAREIYDFNVKCNDPFEADYLLSGDKVKVTKKGDGFCIEKISK